MKRILVLFLIITLNLSCSSSDDNNEFEQNIPDEIIAKWQFGKVVYFYENGSLELIQADYCDLLSSYEFKDDNTIDFISVIENSNNGCKLEIPDLEYFNWSKIEEGKYRIISKKINEQEETNIENITFQSDEMIWTEIINDSQSNIIKIENYFTRIN